MIAPKAYHPLIERQLSGSLSKQPRFSTSQNQYSFADFYRTFRQMAETKEPEYVPNSYIRDRWLQDFRYAESHVAGVINQITLIYANRGWAMTGGRNQVRKFTRRLHESEGGKGWRYLIKRGALSFLTTDINCVMEVEREGDVDVNAAGDIVKSPLVRLNNVDPTRCRLIRQKTTLPNGREWLATLEYGNQQKWFDWDFIRVASMPSDREEYMGLGFCFLSRAIRFVKLLYGVYLHDQEKLDSDMMDGLLLLNNISESQWQTSMEARKENQTALERRRYGGVQILTGGGEFGAADAKLIGLSQLPDDFNRETFIDQCMYGIALCAGFAPNELWVVNAGVLGRGKETEIQVEGAETKGGEDFPLSLQENLQGELPETVHFEFEERNIRGELVEAQVAEAKASVIKAVADIGVLSDEQKMMLLAQAGLIPEEWTTIEEDVEATDQKAVKARMLENPKIRSACEEYPRQPIIQYNWNGLKGKEVVLWERGEEALKRRTWVLNRYVYRGDRVVISPEQLESVV